MNPLNFDLFQNCQKYALLGKLVRPEPPYYSVVQNNPVHFDILFYINFIILFIGVIFYGGNTIFLYQPRLEL